MAYQDDPLVIVIPDRMKVSGIDDPDEDAQVWKAVPLSEALSTRYDTFAHFFLYTVHGEKKWPRINKPALPPLRDNGTVITVDVTCLDWDTGRAEAHVAWDRSAYEKFLKELERAIEKQNLPAPTLVYKTRGGARILFHHPSLEPEKAEAFHRYLVSLYAEAGILCDGAQEGAIWEWNRPHALPYVTRDGEAIDPEPFGGTGEALDSVPEFDDPGYRLGRAMDSSILRAELPDPNDAMNLVWRPGSGKLTPWGLKAAKRMRERDPVVCFDYSEPPQITRDRNTTLFKWIASLVSMLYGNPKDTTPEHVWGVIRPAAVASSRADGRDLPAECWKMTCYCWAKEAAQHTVNEEDAKTFMGTMREGVKLWWPKAPEDEEEFAQALRKKLILVHHNDYYVLQENGLYASHPVKGAALVASLRHSGLVGKDRLLTGLESNGPKGPTRLTGQTAIDVFGSPIQKVDITGGPPIGGYLRGKTLQVSRYTRRDDIPAEFHQKVQDWLECMFEKNIETGMLWTAGAQAVDRGPIAAMSINAPTGIGKDMYALGLSETFSSQTYAGKDMFEKWQYFVDETPLVWVNEREPPECSAFDVRLRELIGGAYLTVDQKHQALVRINASFRVLMTANTESLAAKLFSRRGMTKDEREATEVRLIHLNLSDRARRHLRKMGTWDYTKGWVKGTHGEPSEGIVAQHFMWIYENTKLPASGGRFILDGTIGQWNRGLFWEDEAVADIGELLVSMVEQNRIKGSFIGAQHVLDYMDNLLSNRWRGWNLVTVGRAMQPFTGPRRRSGLRRIKFEVLRHFAQHMGLNAPRLVALKKTKKGKVEA